MMSRVSMFAVAAVATIGLSGPSVASIMTPSGSNEVLVDSIVAADFSGGSVDGQNGWTQVAPQVIFETNDDGRFYRNGGDVNPSIASNDVTVTSGDNAFRIALTMRLRDEDASNRVNQLQLFSGGTEVFSFGTGQGSLVEIDDSDVFVASQDNTVSPTGHTYYYMEIYYDEVSESGTVIGNVAAAVDTTGPADLFYGSFTGAIDVDAIDQVRYRSNDGGGTLQAFGISSSQVVPEPSAVALTLLAATGLGAVWVRRRLG